VIILAKIPNRITTVSPALLVVISETTANKAIIVLKGLFVKTLERTQSRIAIVTPFSYVKMVETTTNKAIIV
jgi:hypothetical protein